MVGEYLEIGDVVKDSFNGFVICRVIVCVVVEIGK